ncbi:uncharacterized protein TM35_000741120, partial [Trypanosoma theileri]
TCGYTMAAAAVVDNDSPSGRGVSRGAVEVSCGAGGALRVRPAAESEWLTCGAGSRVPACVKYADLCRQRTARTTRTATTTTATTVNAGRPKAVMAFFGNRNHSDGGYIFNWNEGPEEKPPATPVDLLGNKRAASFPLSDTDGLHKTNEDKSASGVEATANMDRLEKVVPAATPKPVENVDSNVVEQEREHGSAHENLHSSGKQLTQPVNTDEGNQRDEPNAKDSTGNSNEAHLSTNTVDTTSGSVTQPTAGVSTTDNNNSANMDSNNANTSSNEESTTATITTTTITTTTLPPVPVPNADINNVASTMKNRPNVDSSVNPVWMRTAAPLLIVGVLFSFTVY